MIRFAFEERNPRLSYILNVIYLLAAIAYSPFLIYAAVIKGKYRSGWMQKLCGQVPQRDGNRPCVWLHGVSVGEVNLLATLVLQLESRYPQFEYVFSTTTAAGFELAKQKFKGRHVFNCPIDFSWAVKNAIRRIRPNVLILGELEIWPNLINEAKRQSISVAVVNARLSQNSFGGYRRIQSVIRPVLQQIDLIAAQSDEYAERFLLLGAPRQNTVVSGSVKFDGANADRKNPRTIELAALAGISPSDLVFLAGSTQSPEEELALDVFRELSRQHPNLRLILVPRHPERFDSVAKMLRREGVRFKRRSQLPESSPQHERILLVDTIGELGAWWGTAQIAYVGGSMGDRGGQNMIEPAAYGAAVSFGPNTKNFRDVVQQLLDRDAAVVVKDREELKNFVERCLQDAAWQRSVGQRAKSLVAENRGALQRTIRCLSPLIERVDDGPIRRSA